MNKEEREKREFVSLFADQRYSKQNWRKLMAEALVGDAAKLPTMVDKNGEQTLDSAIEQMAYNNVAERLAADGKSRKPMQAEVIVEANIIRARFSDGTFNMILDRTAGKVKEEVSITDNPYDDLSLEELEALKAMREKKKAEGGNPNENS